MDYMDYNRLMRKEQGIQENKERMNEERIVNLLLDAWKETRQFTVDWVKELPLSQMNAELPRPGLNSFTKHIYEMGEVQKIYTAVLRGEEANLEKATNLTFESENIVANTKDELLDFLNKCNKEFYNAVKAVEGWETTVPIFGEEKPKLALLELLTRHEAIHHGQFIAFGYVMGVKFPQSWIEAWALPSE